MACSEARLAANRANAQKSTGPQTAEGKEASRRNSFKHGLTGAGLVVPGEDAAEIARESAAFLIELAPDGLPTARLLAERVATLAVRLRRSARHESAATAERTRIAALDFDESRRAEARRLFEAIDGGTHRADLLAMPEGVDLLDATLAELKALAEAGAAGWSRAASARLMRCLALDARAHAEALGRALVDGDLSGLDRGIVAVMDHDRVCGPWALDQVIGLVDAERADLAALRPTLDLEAIARARIEAVHLALVDAEPATLLARKYEAATERALYRALREIREARKPAPAVITPPFPTPAEPARPADASRRQPARVEPVAAPPLGSSFPGTLGLAASNHKSTVVDVEAAPRGRSRYEDRRQRPKLGR